MADELRPVYACPECGFVMAVDERDALICAMPCRGCGRSTDSFERFRNLKAAMRSWRPH